MTESIITLDDLQKEIIKIYLKFEELTEKVDQLRDDLDSIRWDLVG